jgi:serine/threonine protein kinase/tetratricopeptide (TPR) repeat protein
MDLSKDWTVDVELRPSLRGAFMAADPVRIADQIRFGEDFELDLRSYELRRAGRVRKMERIPKELLLLLIEKRGQLVTRDEIVERIWGKGVFLDTDNSINAAVRKIRQVLKDDPEQPHFVQTITGRGYRFIAPVSEVVRPNILPAGAAEQAHAAENLEGRKVSHYRILQVLGGGGMGVVYKAEDLKLGRKVAVKFLPAEMTGDARAFERLEREARAASALEHPNICPIYELGEHDGQPFIVMQLLAGQTLEERIEGGSQQRKPLPVNEVLAFALQIVAGLEAAHAKGIIHRDIKPANIFITTRNEVKILDFGLAKAVENDLADTQLSEQAASAQTSAAAPPAIPSNLRLTRTGTTVGTAHYMSPEQVRSEKLDARTDLFSFGLVLYEMATSQRAFPGGTAAVVYDGILHRAPQPIPQLRTELLPGLEPVISKALEKDRNLRYQSAAEILTDLRRVSVAAGSPSSAPTIALPDTKTVKAPEPHPSKRWRILTPVLVLVVAAVVSGGFYFRSVKANRLTDKDTIVLADFANSTGDSVFDATLKQALVIALRQSPFLNILPDSKVSETLKLMTYPENTPVTATVAREVCQRTGSKAYVAGNITRLGSEYVIGLSAVNCQDGETLSQQQVTSEVREKVIPMLGAAAAKLRSNLGESLATVQKFDVSLPQATTASLDALKEYSLGNQIESEKGPTAAIPHYEKAAALDPQFASAYIRLAVSYFDAGEDSLAAVNATKAYELRDRVSERERLQITAYYHTVVTGNLEKAVQAYELLADTFPRLASAHGSLGYTYVQIGRNDKFLAESQVAWRLNPGVREYGHLIAAHMVLGQLEEAKAALAQSQSHFSILPEDHTNLYLIAFLEHDTATMDREVAWAAGKPGVQDVMLYYESCTSGYFGRLRKARDLSQLASNSALAGGEKETAASYQADEALREALFGNVSDAKKRTATALATSNSREVQVAAALAYAFIGDATPAQRIAANLAKHFPESSVVQLNYLPAIRGQIAVGSRNPTGALEFLETAQPYELGYPGQSILLNLYPIYVRGEAYLAAHNGPAAVAEFQKILDHPGIALNQPIAALAHLQLGRAQALAGNQDKARAAYQDFVILWRDADPGIPILRQAKAEQANLN